jgi:hypothetical protein
MVLGVGAWVGAGVAGAGVEAGAQAASKITATRIRIKFLTADMVDAKSSFEAKFFDLWLNKNPCRLDREAVRSFFDRVPPPCREACGNEQCGGRPGFPHRVRNTVARQRRTLTGFAFRPSHPGERHRNRNKMNC